VDAALDTTFIANIANYFGKALNCKPHWIRNKYIRPSNRSISLHAILQTIVQLKKVSGGVRDQAIADPSWKR
jgi:hypothetical protein